MEAALAVTLLAPPIPMLFMGEEWGSKVPFPFFCDFKGDLAEAVRNGRRQEYAWAYDRYGDEVPDPLSVETFQSAKLDWTVSRHAGAARLDLVTKLLSVRSQEIVPRLAGSRFGGSEISGEDVLSARWRMGDASALTLLANLSDTEVKVEKDAAVARTIWGKEPAARLAGWSVLWRIGGP
jgi:maltooligosyltrehalose trehalohydrolase